MMLPILLKLTTVAAAIGSATRASCGKALPPPLDPGPVQIDPEHFKIAVVRQTPVNFPLPVALNTTWVNLDLKATIAQAKNTINEAASQNVGLLAFPELFFPGYPVAINTAYTPANIAQYVSQSFTADGAEFREIAHAFRDAGMYGSFGFSERHGNFIYMAQVLIGPDGSVLKHRRKLRPSGTERSIWSDGELSGLEVVSTPVGRIGMLECWEHFHPTMTFAMQAQMANIHIAGFPYAADAGADPLGWQSWEVNAAVVRTYAVNSRAYVLMPSVGSAAIFGPDGLAVAEIMATDRPDEVSFITATVNTTQFAGAPTYSVNGEESWAALQQMVDGFPAYIPKVGGGFFERRNNSIEDITKAE